MKFVIFVPVLLAGCAVSGSWLDNIGRPVRPPVAMSDKQAADIAGEAAQLRGQADSLRARLSSESDRRQRFRYYEELRILGDRLVPLERQLLDAGRPPRSA